MNILMRHFTCYLASPMNVEHVSLLAKFPLSTAPFGDVQQILIIEYVSSKAYLLRIAWQMTSLDRAI
jgi:hypothetical protein